MFGCRVFNLTSVWICNIKESLFCITVIELNITLPAVCSWTQHPFWSLCKTKTCVSVLYIQDRRLQEGFQNEGRKIYKEEEHFKKLQTIVVSVVVPRDRKQGTENSQTSTNSQLFKYNLGNHTPTISVSLQESETSCSRVHSVLSVKNIFSIDHTHTRTHTVILKNEASGFSIFLVIME